jgi:hypothetical protein
VLGLLRDAQGGNSPEDCAKVSGHKSLSMFKRYSDLFSENEEQDRQREVLQRRAAWRAEQAKAQQNRVRAGALDGGAINGSFHSSCTIC